MSSNYSGGPDFWSVHFWVYPDIHVPQVHGMHLKENNSRLTRWSLALQPYQYSVQYRTGQKNGNVDALSRYLVEATSLSQKVGGVSGKSAGA